MWNLGILPKTLLCRMCIEVTIANCYQEYTDYNYSIGISSLFLISIVIKTFLEIISLFIYRIIVLNALSL